MLTGILAFVVQSASWNVYKNMGICCDQCVGEQNGSMMSDCRGLEQEHLFEEGDMDFPTTCTSCYSQGIPCSWAEVSDSEFGF